MGNIGIIDPQWKEYSQCSKFAWLWNYLNNIFIQRDDETIHSFLNSFINNKNILEENHNAFMRSLEIKIHSGYVRNIEWDFSPKELNSIHRMCESLMKKFNYS